MISLRIATEVAGGAMRQTEVYEDQRVCWALSGQIVRALGTAILSRKTRGQPVVIRTTLSDPVVNYIEEGLQP